MEGQLERDLLEVLEGIDPLELITEDPELAAIVQDFYHNQGLSDDAKVSRESGKKKSSTKFCCVCHSPASGFRYFGAIVCNGCRAFFSRSVKADAYESFVCQSQDMEMACDNNSKKKAKQCQKCRFASCLKEGMVVPKAKRPSKTEGHSSTPARRNDYCSLLQLLTKKSSLSKLRILHTPSLLFTPDEKKSLAKEMDFHLNATLGAFLRLMAGDLAIYRGWLEFMFYGKPLPIKLQKQMDAYLNYSNREEYLKTTQLGMWGDVGHRDRLRLATANVPLVALFLLTSRLMGKDVDYKQEILGYVELLKKFTDDKGKENYIKIFKEVNATMKMYCTWYTLKYILTQLCHV